MVGHGLLAVAVSLGFAATTHACWYPYDAEDCFMTYQGVKTDCEASYELLSMFIDGLAGIFAPDSSASNGTNGTCLLHSPYSCTATYTSYLANGGKGVNATYPACPADIQTALRAWIDAGAFDDSASAPAPSSPRTTTPSTPAPPEGTDPSTPSSPGTMDGPTHESPEGTDPSTPSSPRARNPSTPASTTSTTPSIPSRSSLPSIQAIGGTASVGGAHDVPIHAGVRGR